MIVLNAFLAAAASQFGALVRKSSSQGSIDSSADPLTWDVEVYDTAGWHSGSSSEFVVPSGVSLVQLTSSIVATVGAELEQQLNGATFRGRGRASSGVASQYINMISAPIAVVVDDAFQTLASKSSGSMSVGADEESFAAIEVLDSATKYALVYNAAAQTVGASVNTILNWPNEVADTDSWHSFASTVTITIASPGVVTWTAHGMANGTPITLSTTGALPTGLTAGTTYYVINQAANTFQLAATPGGTAINTSGSQSGTHTATDNSSLRVPSGVTLIECGAGSNSNGTDQHFGQILKNGATARGLPVRDTDTATNTINMVSAPIVVTDGDRIQYQVFDGTGGSVPNSTHVYLYAREYPSTIKRCLAYKTATQTLPTVTATSLTWQAEEYDTDGIHDNSTNTHRFTAPANTVYGRIRFSFRTSSTTGYIMAWSFLNGADYYGMARYDSDTAGTDCVSAISAWYPMAAGDWLAVAASHQFGCDIPAANETWAMAEFIVSA